MTRTVILTRDDKIRLNNLTKIVQETSGALLYREKQINEKRICPVEYSFILGIGDEGHSQLIPERIKILNEFVKNRWSIDQRHDA